MRDLPLFFRERLEAQNWNVKKRYEIIKLLTVPLYT